MIFVNMFMVLFNHDQMDIILHMSVIFVEYEILLFYL